MTLSDNSHSDLSHTENVQDTNRNDPTYEVKLSIRTVFPNQQDIKDPTFNLHTQKMESTTNRYKYMHLS